jgi:uncharacterized membrane protein YcaP (DUF421 family)
MSEMWHDMFDAGISYGEKTLRTVLVYLTLVILLRLTGKRGLAQLNTFDLVVMLLLSNVVQNAVIGNDNSLVGGLFGAAVLMAVNALVNRYGVRFNWFYRLFEGSPTVLAKDGVYNMRALRHEGVRRDSLDVAIRHQGGSDVAETSRVVLEPGGTLLVDLNDADQPADKADIERLRAQLARIERQLAGS